MYVLTTTHTGTTTRTDVHGPVVSTGPGLQRERGEAVSVESEFMIELDEPIDELGAEAGDVLLIRPGHPRPYSLTRFLPEERVARACHKLMRYLPEDVRGQVLGTPQSIIARAPGSPRVGGRPHARPRAHLRLLRVDD